MKAIKHIVLLALVSICISSLFAQKIKETKVPLEVKNAFHSRFPEAKKVSWEQEAANYEVSFIQNGEETSVVLSSLGVVLETEVEIPMGSLPSKISVYIHDNYKGAKIKEAAKITSEKGIVSYEAEIKNQDLIFDADGNFLKSIKK